LVTYAKWYIMSPNSLYDTLKQRGRVSKGTLNDIKSGKSSLKIIIGLKRTLEIIAIFRSYFLSPL